MRICSKCQLEKPEDDYRLKNKTTGERRHICKGCVKIYASEHYQKNKEAYLTRTKRDKKKESQKDLELLMELKRSCCKCGFSHFAALDFHHIDPSIKDFTISKMSSRVKIREEAKKCIILCSNCHRIHHWNEKYGTQGGTRTPTLS